jgi:hypothetical protein
MGSPLMTFGFSLQRVLRRWQSQVRPVARIGRVVGADSSGSTVKRGRYNTEGNLAGDHLNPLTP